MLRAEVYARALRASKIRKRAASESDHHFGMGNSGAGPRWLAEACHEMRLSTLGIFSHGHLGATQESHQRRRGGSWCGVPKRLNNSALFLMQKQTQKRLMSGFKIIP